MDSFHPVSTVLTWRQFIFWVETFRIPDEPVSTVLYWRFSTQTTLYRQCRHIRMDSFHPVLKIFYSNNLVSTVSTCSLSSIVHFEYWMKLVYLLWIHSRCVSTVSTWRQFIFWVETFRIPDEPVSTVLTYSDGFLSSSINSVDMKTVHLLSRNISNTRWTCIDSVVLKIFYSNNLVSIVSTYSDGFLSFSIEDFLLKQPCINSVDMLSVFNSTFRILDETRIFASNPFSICIDSVDMKAVHLVLMLYYWKHTHFDSVNTCCMQQNKEPS